jgi:hypothetical protein
MTGENEKVNDSHHSPMGLRGSWEVRLPDSVTLALEGGKLSAVRTGRLYPPSPPREVYETRSEDCHAK